ncbi:MAG: hypothetical protein JKY52_12515 [Flavobacteriales bacterium]|nr:hypothetical protein [Flavobacteriales bacterium]
MNATQFIEYLEHPLAISESATADLGDLITQFPYFQSARLLYLKGLHQNKSIEYPKVLKITSAYANDRKKLYELIMQEDLHKQIKLVEDLSGPDKNDHAADLSPLEAQILQEAVNASIKLEVSKQTEEIAEEKDKVEITAVKEPKVKSDKLSGRKSFNEWLRARGSQRIDESVETTEGLPGHSKLIDKFIETTPKVKDARSAEAEREKQAFFSPVDTARLSLIDDPSFVTETLASIYEAQGYHDKAIKAYELLCLKYPEKRDNFAARITNLKDQLGKGT